MATHLSGVVIGFSDVEEPRADRPIRFSYEALPGDSLLLGIEGERDGQPVTQHFRYGRVR